MQELIDKLMQNAGLTEEQSKKTVNVVAEYVKEKFPMISGAVDQIFPKQNV